MFASIKYSYIYRWHEEYDQRCMKSIVGRIQLSEKLIGKPNSMKSLHIVTAMRYCTPRKTAMKI